MVTGLLWMTSRTYYSHLAALGVNWLTMVSKVLAMPTVEEVMQDAQEPPVWSAWRTLPDQGPSVWYDVARAIDPFEGRARYPLDGSDIFTLECSPSDFPKIFSKLSREGLQLLAECRTILT